MKLKKIASLALAGVMAVSMLAGCSASTVDPEQPTVPTTPVAEGTTEVSTAVGDRVVANLAAKNKKLPEQVTFANDSGLSADLKYAVEYSGVLEALSNYVITTELGDLYNSNVVSVLASEAGVTQLAFNKANKDHTVWNIGNEDTLLVDEEGRGMTMPKAVGVELYAISGSIGENAVNQKVADKIADTVAAYVYSVSDLNNNSGDNASSIFNHEYTVSVSTCTKTVNSSMAGIVAGDVESNRWGTTTGSMAGGVIGAENPTVTFVAVQVVRTSTHH